MTEAVKNDDSRQQFWKFQRIWQQIVEDVDLQVDRACGWHTGLCRYIEKGDVETVEKIFKYDPIFANQPIYQHLRKTSLYIACKTLNGKKAVFMVKVLLKYGANPNIQTKTGVTPLMKFLKKDRSNVPSVEEFAVSVVTDLLNAGSLVNIADKKGNTALKIALEYGRLECLNILLQHIHKKCVGRKQCLRIFSRTGRLPKEWLIMLKAGAGDLKTLDHLLQDSSVFSSFKKYSNILIHHLLSSFHHIPCVSCLREFYARPIPTATDMINVHVDGNTSPLLLMCRTLTGTKATQAINFILQKGADPNVTDEWDRSPLMEVIKGQTNRSDSENLEVMHFLLDAGAKIDVKESKHGLSPLMYAAMGSNIKTLKLLLKTINNKEKLVSVVNTTTTIGLTSLHLVMISNKNANIVLELMEFLLKCGADPNISTTKPCEKSKVWKGTSPLLLACRIMLGQVKGAVDIIKLLLKHGADPNIQDEAKCSSINTPLKEALERRCDSRYVEDAKEAVYALVSSGAQSDLSTGFELTTPLIIAAQNLDIECLQILLFSIVDPATRAASINKQGVRRYDTAMIRACSHSLENPEQAKEVAALLLQNGADPNLEANLLFDSAIRSRNHELLNLLLDHGAKLTSSMISCHIEESLEMVDQLLLWGIDPSVFLCFVNECSTNWIFNNMVALLEKCLKFSGITREMYYLVKHLVVKVLSSCMESPELESLLIKPFDNISRLQELCRVKIRQHLHAIHSCKIEHFILELPLPQHVKSYLSHSGLEGEMGFV